MPLITDNLTFGGWLKRRRRALDLTQDALAARIGASSLTLQKIERGARRPSQALAERLAEALRIPVEERARFFQMARTGGIHYIEERNEPALRLPRLAPPAIELVGREAEQALLIHRFCEAKQRLVTLVGPGGIGKTTLATQVAIELQPEANPASPFTDGVAIILLAPLTSAHDLPLAMAQSLNLRLRGGQPTLDQLLEALRDQHLLLVFDNSEHLLGEGDGPALTELISRVLTDTAGVQILVTSRERLLMRQEHIVELGGLALPTGQRGIRIDRAEAVQLFVERAQRVATGFALSAENRSAVAQICQRLEGMPLAIELAAAWTRVLAPREIIDEIDRSLDFLAGTGRDVPARHRSMRAALDHSWQLLNGEERAILTRLSVFRGGWDRDAAIEILSTAGPTPTLSTPILHTLLASLIDKSLVQRREQAGATRYALHELVRQYAAGQLAETPDVRQAVESRHTAYYASLLERSIIAQTGGSSPEARSRLNRNSDNIHTAWLRGVASGNDTLVTSMGRSLMVLYDLNGWHQDALTLFARAVDTLPGTARIGRGIALGYQAYFLIRLGQAGAAVRLLEEGIALLEAAGEKTERAQFMLHLGTAKFAAAQYGEARQHHQLALELTDPDDSFTRLWATMMLSTVLLEEGNVAMSEQLAAECLEIWRQQHYARGVVTALLHLAEIHRLQGQIDTAEALAQESLQVSSTARDTSNIADSLREVGVLAIERGNLREAHYLLTESCESLRALGDWWIYARSRSQLARLEVQLGEIAQARRGCAELLKLVNDGTAIMLVEAAYALALTLIAEGTPQEALAVLIALAEASGERSTLQRAAALRAELAQRLSASELLAARTQAQARSLIPWLEEICSRPSRLVASPTSAPVNIQPTPEILPGALAIPETGETLSPREIDVLRLLISGRSNQEIANTLIISIYTVKNHVASILQKLGVTTRTQAALRGRALGLG